MYFGHMGDDLQLDSLHRILAQAILDRCLSGHQQHLVEEKNPEIPEIEKELRLLDKVVPGREEKEILDFYYENYAVFSKN